MILTWLTNFAFAAGGIIVGIILTSCIVAADWHEKPRRHRGWWMKASDGYAECTKCGFAYDATEETYGYCPQCGAEMKGVKRSKCEN